MATSSSLPTHGLFFFSKGSPSQVAENVYEFPEIHLNVWESESDNQKNTSDSLLDIGLMLDVRDQTTSIELVFPTKINLSDVKDLSSIVSQPQAIPAVFNESWVVASQGSNGSDAVVSDPATSNMSFAIVDVTDAINEISYSGYDALSINIPKLIERGNLVAQDMHQTIKRVYVRFRLLKFKRDFYCVGAGRSTDKWWQPSWQRTEDIDFRINVRRGAPPGLERIVGGRFLAFSKVHLFLMRSRDKDIIFQDKLFKASRSLEDEEFWAQYSIHGTQMDRVESLKRVKNSLGYHWKSGNPGPVNEFGTLARFKIVEFGVGKFVAVAIIVGAMGNMLWDGAKLGYGWLFPSATVQEHSTNCSETKTPSLSSDKERKSTAKEVDQTRAKKETK